jgi:hypothetical protein
MLEFDSKKAWYENNKEFLREFEKTEEFKSYRNGRIRLKKVIDRLNCLEPFKIEIQLLEKEKVELFNKLEEKYLLMRIKKTRAEEIFFKKEQKPTKQFKILKKSRLIKFKGGK